MAQASYKIPCASELCKLPSVSALGVFRQRPRIDLHSAARRYGAPCDGGGTQLVLSMGGWPLVCPHGYPMRLGDQEQP